VRLLVKSPAVVVRPERIKQERGLAPRGPNRGARLSQPVLGRARSLPADTDDLPEKQDPATAAFKLLHWIPLNLGPLRGTAVFALGGLRAIIRFYDDEDRGSICLGVLRFDPGHTLRRELLRQLLASHHKIRLS
jgi:hypothetical protein